jgi:signal transduction histidine kinase/CheY-like chemotaxis protein/HPt (histidine-containing phosphotransfer) domain-containing protein
MKKERIRWRVFVPLAITFVITFGAVLLGFFDHMREHIDQAAADRLQDVRKSYTERIEQDAERISTLIELLAQDSCLRSAWIAGDKARLLACAEPRFKELQEHYQVTRFSFHDLQRTGFLSVHDPSQEGGFVDRFTLVEAIKSGKPVHGVELDPDGTPALWIVYPWQINGKRVGYIEMGVEITHILRGLRDLLGVEVFLTVEKAYLTKEGWEHGREVSDNPPDWELFPECALIDGLTDLNLGQLRPCFKDTLAHRGASGFELVVNGRTYGGSYLPVVDYVGRNIGSIGVLTDVTEMLDETRKFLPALVVGTAGVTFILATFFWGYFGRVEHDLVTAKETLEWEVEEHRKAEALLRRNEKKLEREIQQHRLVAAEERVLGELLRLAIQEIPMQVFLRQALVTLLNSVPWTGLLPKGAIFLTDEEGRGKHLKLQVDYDLAPELGELCSRIPFGKCLCGRAAESCEVQFTNCKDTESDIQFPDDESHCHYNVPILFDDRVLGVLAIYLPIEYQRVPREEEFLRRVGDILSLGISKRYSDEALVAARVEAEDASKAKSRFLATMSHEIRTPMNGVLGMTELLKDTQLTYEQREYVDTIHHSGRSLLAIINDILDFSKVEAGRLELAPIPFDLERAVHDVGQLLLPKAEKKGLELILDFSSDCSQRLVGDAGRIRQILMNLVGNAIKFTQKGHILLQVRCHTASDTDARVEVVVEDTGIGISEQERTRLFESFFQVDGSFTRQYGGTGLGLAISRQLVELMGGEIGVDSTQGKGSRFWFNLSLPLGSKPEPLPFASLAGVRVLVVDDNMVNLRVMEEQLKSVAMEVETVTDGEQAIELLKQGVEAGSPFQLVLFDFDMPGQDGEAVAYAVRSDERLKSVPLVLLTSFGKKGDAARFKEAGYSAYLSKPVLSTVLYQTLSSVLGLKGRGEEAPIITRHTIEEVVQESFNDEVGFRGHVLLVEDVPANQKVAAVMLQRFGIEVDLAENGKQALEKWEQGQYELILMDCQMPVMDGYDATRAIRSRTDRERTPIVALTANALESDRKRCAAAGMDDFIAKPFERNDLVKVLERWLPSDSLVGTGIESVAKKKPLEQKAASDSEPSLDHAQMEAMREALGEDFDDLITTYVEGVEEMLRVIPQAWETSDLKELERQVHSIKSSSASVGAMALSKLARTMEDQARSNELVEVAEQVQEMELEFQRVREIIET